MGTNSPHAGTKAGFFVMGKVLQMKRFAKKAKNPRCFLAKRRFSAVCKWQSEVVLPRHKPLGLLLLGS